ncbi:MAG TPA: Bax inhibitor-1 family protein [Gemmataceae bacterium]|jgi:FtsH-binding integral membrane protein|nr:Bax inhibitor-1 family protein [Gemmataceae bacterium]
MALYLQDGYHGEAAIHAPESERAAFIRRTYLHLAASVAALVGIEALLLQGVKTQAGQQFLAQWFSSPVSLLVMLAFFIGTGFFARYLARGDMPVAVKYAGLGLYTFLQAVILLPILYVATTNPKFGDTNIVNQAAFLTLVTFAGLTLTVFVTKRDFSGLGPILMVASFVILGVIVAGILFGFGLGLWISFACIALAAGYILYDTSNVLHHYGTNEHVGAALELLSDVVLLFYHILRVLMLSRND